jgi:hypothetical protein
VTAVASHRTSLFSQSAVGFATTGLGAAKSTLVSSGFKLIEGLL